MDAKRFDSLTKAVADRSNRRSALTRLGLGGLFGAAAGGGLARGALAANGDETCVLQFHARTAVGPHAKKVYEGKLTLVIGADGEIDDGSFDDGSGGDQPTVTGAATGRALTFRFDFPNGDNLDFEGTAAQDLALCRGRIDGTFGGPGESDLGTWRATMGSSAGSGNSTSGNATGGNASGGNSSGGNASGGNASSGNGSSGNSSNGTGASGNSSGSANSAGSSGDGSCPSELQFCDGSTPCCEAFSPYEATNISCVGSSCRCMYSCAQAGCASNSTSTFMTIACAQNPNDLCASLGCD